jgi:hypothetical protein
MKKFFVGFVVLVCCALFGMAAFAGDMKLVEIGPGLSVMAPEKAPDLQKFFGDIVATEKYDNGNSLGILALVNKDQTVGSMVLLARMGDNVHVLAVVVFYEKGESDLLVDFLEDVQFMKNGKPSGILSYVKELTDIKVVRGYVALTPI